MGRRDSSQVEVKAKMKVKDKVEIKENDKSFRADILEKKVEINGLCVDLWSIVIKPLGNEVN
jgi:hypothetical protein